MFDRRNPDILFDQRSRQIGVSDLFRTRQDFYRGIEVDTAKTDT
jgi:hypothetical protein